MKRQPVVLTESSPLLPPSASSRDLACSSEAARLQAGVQVYVIPPDFERCGDADGALWRVPLQQPPTHGVWIGYIPDPERYAAIHAVARQKGIVLVNSPDEHLRAQELDRALDSLADLTPRSVVVHDLAGCDGAIAQLGLPVFVKGTVQSRKARGLSACVAQTADELRALVSRLLELNQRSRGRVIVRELVPLRHARHTPGGFPMGREFRAFVCHGELLGLGYYWDADDQLARLSDDEESAVRALVLEAARRANVPWIAIDVGQLDDGRWIVIETGDAQFSGLSQVEPLPLWNRLCEALAAHEPTSPPHASLELVVFVGIQGAGKSTTFHERFAGSHAHVSKDNFRNAANRDRRQEQLIRASLGAGQSVVVDNTNPTPTDRAPLIALAREFGARIVAYYFPANVDLALARNRARTGKDRVPDDVVRTWARRLLAPTRDEGFDEVHLEEHDGNEGVANEG